MSEKHNLRGCKFRGNRNTAIQTYICVCYIKIMAEGGDILPKRNRGQAIYFMVSDREREMIEEKMKQAGIRNMRAYLLKMAIDGYVIRLDLSDVREMVSLLGNATNNLNQIARRANSTNSIYETDIEDIREHYNRLWDKAEDIMRKLAEI